jgi:hypothetical protein
MSSGLSVPIRCELTQGITIVLHIIVGLHPSNNMLKSNDTRTGCSMIHGIMLKPFQMENCIILLGSSSIP